MVLDIILPILVQLVADPISKYVVSPVKRHVSYVFKCDSKVQELQDQVEKLNNKKLRLQQSVDDATRAGEEIFPDVTRWLTTAEQDMGEAEELIQRKDEAKSKCLLGFCPNLKTRHQLSKNVEKKALAIGKLCNQEGLDPISFRCPLQQIVEPSVYNREALPSRLLMLNKVMDALRDPDLETIGVYGMGGVGKTTLAKEVYAKAVQEKLFETIVVVSVSHSPEVRRIQGEIADFVGLKFSMEEVPGRASELRRELEQSNSLIILDDIWVKLDFNAIGVPSQGSYKGCKIMLTSRNRDLLSSEMCVQKLFSLEALKEEETITLFEISVAEAKDPEFHSTATEIAKKCAGLPLLIQLVATELKHKELYEWNNKLNQLSTFGDEEIYEKVYKALESSYENLPGKEIKSFFLLCALFGQSNIEIHYLLTHSMGLGLFKNMGSVEAARDKVFTMVNKLIAKSLLLDGDMVGFVKIHDVVRNTALSIASRVQRTFIGAGKVGLDDWPDEDCVGICLPYCDVSELPLGMNYPKAELFLLFTEDLSLQIPESFFNGLKKLKVVDLTGMRLVPLPSSIGLLPSLRTLCLRGCRLDNMTMLGDLKHLEFLSLENSNVAKLPGDIEHLTRLKLLDLRNCSDLLVIPAGVLSRLCSLEELYIVSSFVRWGSRGNASLAELDSLSNLVALEIEIKDPKMIPIGFMCFSQLRRYKISIGRVWDWNGQYGRSRTLKLKVERGICLEEGIELLLKKSDDLYLDGVGGIDSVFYEGFPQLKQMRIQNDSHIQYLIKLTSNFPALESLHLKNLQKLEKICSGPIGARSFGELQILSISRCDKLTSLISISSGECLQQLRELELGYCKSMETVVGEDAHHNSEMMEFTQLTSLKMKELPHLTGFCKSENMGLLFDAKVCFPNLTSLEVTGCTRLKYIFTASMMKCLVKLKKLEIKHCRLVEQIIQNKKMEDDGTKIILFPELDYLSFEYLPNLKRFSSFCSIEFPLLSELNIVDCNQMENFVSRDSSGESEEYLFNEKVIFSNLEIMRIRFMNSFRYLWDEQLVDDDSFIKLKSIRIEACPKLSVVFPLKICTRFQGVESLTVVGCEEVEEIYHSIDFKEKNYPFSLRDLRIKGLPSLKHIWNKDAAFSNQFQNLQSVSVDYCKDLKYIFSASVGCSLLQLQQLKVENCSQLEVVIAKENDEEGVNACFQFLELTKLQFENLKKMRSLYEGGPHTFEFPKLTSLKVLRCFNISFPKFSPNLNELTIDERGFQAINQTTEFPVELCTKLKKLTLESFNVKTWRASVSSFVSGIKSLEVSVIEWCLGVDDALYKKAMGDEQHTHLRVKHLKLCHVRQLKHITGKDSQHLRTLNIEYCYDMMSIAPSSVTLRNLTTLHLDSCHKVRNLVAASTAKTMVQLMEIKVMNCSMIEGIVAKDGDGTEPGVIIFNKLKVLELMFLPIFNSFCSNKYTFSFPLLEQVSIQRCPRMNLLCAGVMSTPKLQGIIYEDQQHWEGNPNDTILSQSRKWVGEHLKEGRLYQNLESLELVNNASSSKAISENHIFFLNKLRNIRVRDCGSVQVAFDLEGDVELLPELNELELINLPMMTQLCNIAPKGISHFNKLAVLKIEKCSRLKHAFTWSMASCLSQLERVEVKNCEMMETLIVDEEDVATKEAVFSVLIRYVALKDMPKFSSIYSGSGDLKCPLLLKVTVRDCPNIKALFISRHAHSSNPVSTKVNELSIDMKSIRGMMQCDESTNLFENVKFIEVLRYSVTAQSHKSLVGFLSRSAVPDRIVFCDSSVKESLKCKFAEALTIIHIKSLTLRNPEDLNKIWWHASLSQSLVTLEVHKCNRSMDLMTPSMTRNMVQLKVLRVSYCKMLVEIVGDGSDRTTNEIVFTNLKTLELIALQSLKAFSLAHCNLKFPCLDKVILHGCPNLRIFCHGITDTPLLNCVLDSSFHGKRFWEDNLNTTTEHMYQKMVGIEGATEISLSAFPVLKEKWEALYPTSFLSSLERLEVDNCELFSNALSSRLLKQLGHLEVLVVEKCDSVERVVDLEGLNASEYGINEMRNLKELQLIDLPKLKQVFSKDPHQLLSFENLEILEVDNCGSLTFIFNLSMALSLPKLQHVEVKNCSLVEHIIVISEEETVEQYQTILPSLQSVTLLNLAKLVGFCSTSGVLKFPSLKMIEAAACPNVELFESAFSEGCHSSLTVEENSESVSIENSNSVSSFLGNKVIIPGLEILKVEWKNLKDQLLGNHPSRFLLKLKGIWLTSIQGEEDADFLLTCLRRFLKLDELSLRDSLIEEITLNDVRIRNDGGYESLLVLPRLHLSHLPNLKHLAREDCQPIRMFNYMVYLEVIDCCSLKILVPSWVTFQNLGTFSVSNCDKLINLISASTARSLVQLRSMDVKDCKMMQEIVAVASDGKEYEIRFSELEYLGLVGLPCLESFSSGNYDFHFPSLEEAMITGCPNMKIFAEKVSVSPKLRKVKTGPQEHDWEWEDSLNETIQALYMEEEAEEEAAQSMSKEQSTSSNNS